MEKLNKLYTYLGIVFMLVAIPSVFVYLSQSGATPIPQLGSVTVGNEYTATSTASFSAGVNADRLIKQSYGALGSVIITKAGDTAFQLLDATSTAAIQTDPRFSTSTQFLADFPASTVAGTYVFDVNFTYGLLLEVTEGTAGTTTVTFR